MMLPLIGCVITVSALTHLNIGFHAPFWFPLNGPFRATFPDFDSWPRCFKNHVLLPQAALVTELAAYFDALPDCTTEFLS